MRIDVPFGQDSMRIEVDDERSIRIVSPRRREDSIVNSLSQSIESTDLPSFLANRRRILVVVNDHTRPTPTQTVLSSLTPHLKEREVATIVATGAHRPPSQQELTRFLGGTSPSYGGRIVTHDSRDYACLRPIGRTSRGTKLFFNSRLFDADGIIIVGSVEPHYFAGFTGGRKFLLPGLAGYRSIERNHSFALEEDAQILLLDGNPVHEDFAEALDIFHRNDDIFSIQLVLNSDHKIRFASAGQVTESFMNAVEQAKQCYVTQVEEKADIVISVVKPPMDLDLYQSLKGIENVKLALNDGGILILVSRCDDGIGDRRFYELLASGEIWEKIKEGYELGYHKAAKLAELLKRTSIWAVTNLPPDLLNAISIKPYSDVQRALNDATMLKGKDSNVLIVFDGSLMVPVPAP